ncbi:Uncharacterized protein dnl_01770 [Desulfonema limicola]|uniref:Uncharacterized protein n=1 Tax=Desulfonema limicola TaxID=45656 RepID=A0A975B385_9BACT|nr:Uncharacterized protein dnl_01770 [Desulfonema limicola]
MTDPEINVIEFMSRYLWVFNSMISFSCVKKAGYVIFKNYKDFI